MNSGRHPSEKSVEKCKKSRDCYEKKNDFWVVKLVVHGYVVQTFGTRTLPSEAYFWWLRFGKVW